MDNRVWVKDAVMTIRLPEEVDHFVADRLREEAGEILVERNVREVVFDFRKTVFMDSSGIGLVMGRFREMELIGGKVRAVHVGERMRRILVMSGVTRVILELFNGSIVIVCLRKCIGFRHNLCFRCRRFSTSRAVRRYGTVHLCCFLILFFLCFLLDFFCSSGQSPDSNAEDDKQNT